MFSRIAVKSVRKDVLRNIVQRQVTTTAAVAAFKEGPERDLVNFPRPKMLENSGKVRWGFIPDEWFQFFYPKTGVTGPYVFSIFGLTTLFSKEYLLMDHEMNVGIAMIVIAIATTKLYGPQIRAALDKAINEQNKLRDDDDKAMRQAPLDGIENLKKAQWSMEGNVLIIPVKRENVQWQLEAEYRERLMKAYETVKKRLDYQVEKLSLEQRFTQKNLVDYVVRNVMKSITPQQEKDTLKKCIADLSALAAKA